MAAKKQIELGYLLGYWPGEPPPDALKAIREAERLGFNSAWTAETYGSDALTPLGWWGSQTKEIRLGTAVAQIAARTPAATAMAAMTLDHLSGGRFVLGLGVSGPQVVEGWYGQSYARPVSRTREYIDVVRRIIRREEPVEVRGEFYELPVQGGTGLGKPLKSNLRPLRREIPIFLGAEGPANVALSAELCDGWLPLFFSPKLDSFYRDALRSGFERAGDLEKEQRFEIASNLQLCIGSDVERCADSIRPFLALYIGGMGARGANFHLEVFARMGWEREAHRVQDLYLSGKKAEAASVIPLSMVEDVALVGPPDKIREELDEWRETCVTTFLVSGSASMLPNYADVLLA